MPGNQNKSIALVLGANGYLGQNLCFWLNQNNYRVIAVSKEDHFIGQAVLREEFDYIKANLSDYSQVEDLPFENAQLIFVMAGKTGTVNGFEEYEDFIQSNEIVLLNILKACVNKNIKARIVYPSTRLVYKGQRGRRLKENDEKELKTVYAVNKIACENYISSWGNAFDIKYTIFRICVPYGHLVSKNYSYGTFGFMLDQATKNGNIELFGDGLIYRTFTHIGDICDIMISYSLPEATRNRTLNIGSSDNCSLLDLANMIAQKMKCSISFKPFPKMVERIESGDTMFDDTNLQTIIPYEYRGNLKRFIQSI